MDTKELTAQLVAIHAALVDKIEAQPAMEPMLSLRQDGEWSMNLYSGWKNSDYDVLSRITRKTPEACINAAFDFIAAMSDPATKAKTDWHRKLGDVIDEGHALNLPDAVMTPLRGASQAMTENLIEGPK
jgi:hypothetical protein